MLNCSPLYNIKVVLRKLVSTQAKRRGMRAIEVWDFVLEFCLYGIWGFEYWCSFGVVKVFLRVEEAGSP